MEISSNIVLKKNREYDVKYQKRIEKNKIELIDFGVITRV